MTHEKNAKIGGIQQPRRPNLTQFWPHPPRVDKNGHFTHYPLSHTWLHVDFPLTPLTPTPSFCPRSYWMPPKIDSNQVQSFYQNSYWEARTKKRRQFEYYAVYVLHKEWKHMISYFVQKNSQAAQWFLFVFSIKIKLTETGLTVVIRQLRPEFKFPTIIEMAFSQMLAIRSWFNELQ